MRLIDVDQAIRLLNHLKTQKDRYNMDCETIIYFLNQLHARFPYDDIISDYTKDPDFNIGDLL